jgi:hypothetical protein
MAALAIVSISLIPAAALLARLSRPSMTMRTEALTLATLEMEAALSRDSLVAGSAERTGGPFIVREQVTQDGNLLVLHIAVAHDRHPGVAVAFQSAVLRGAMENE